MGAWLYTRARARSATTLPGVKQTVRPSLADAAHINNLYNTTFWALVLQGGQTERGAHETLKGSYSKDKHEILFSRFGINYDKIPALFRKGTTLVYAPIHVPGRPAKAKPKTELRTLHVDIIQDRFWQPSPEDSSPPVTESTVEPFYEDPRRLACAGLGVLVLSGSSP